MERYKNLSGNSPITSSPAVIGRQKKSAIRLPMAINFLPPTKLIRLTRQRGKAYDSQHVRQAIKDDGAVPVIPYRSNAKHPKRYDKRLYRERNVIERFFCRFKDMRRLSQRFDKLARNYLAAVHLFAIRRWLSY